ncbi:MerR family transcriptional regulator [Occallatibacter savannae]|uniref:MerR family transcriptional regulator n=1 Tax=Occallatibacter savannae TaxID=1002691 RepID=UPI000D69C07F|nr:MerR family transcriptional regulator [Occallatibacter savannae]
MASHPSPKRAVEIPTIPDRLYFKIGDVARLLKVEPYVLRFWESQFPQLKPNKSGTGQRLYRKRDVEVAVEIKRLVYGEGYTLSGARQVLGQQRRADATAAAPGPAAKSAAAKAAPSAPARNDASARNDKASLIISRIRTELREIAGILAAPASSASKAVAMPQVHSIRRKPRSAPLSNSSGSLFDS